MSPGARVSRSLAASLCVLVIAARAAAESPPVLSKPDAPDGLAGLTPTVEGTLYEDHSRREQVLFSWTLYESADRKRRVSLYRNPDGTLAASEELRLDDSGFREYTVVQHGADEKGVIRRVGDRLHFSYTKDGRTRTDSEKLPENFVVGPLLIERIQDHWEAILAGREIVVRLGVTHRTETVGFEIEKEGDTRHEGEPAVRIRMKPDSFVVAAIVDPIHMVFSADGKRVHEVLGRTLPLRRVGNRWKPTVADAVYRRLPPVSAPPRPR